MREQSVFLICIRLGSCEVWRLTWALADWSNVIFHIHDDNCWFEVLVCHFEVSSVGGKALANEDTLLRTHCCRHKRFPVCPRAQHLLRTQILCPGHKKCFWFCSETFLCPQQHSFCVPRVCAPKEHEQQCVLVCQGLKICDVSSFTRRILWRNGVDVWRREAGLHPFLPMVSINFFVCLPFRVIFQPQPPASSHSTTCACRTRLHFVLNFRTTLWL